MRAHSVLRDLLLPCATLLLTLGCVASSARCSESAPSAAAAATPNEAAVACPRTLYLDTVTVRVFETSDMAENMLRAACIGASQRALETFRAQARMSANATTRRCAAQMGAQGCLMGQAFTQPHCTNVMCPLTQKCTVTLVRLDAVKPQA